MVSNSTFQCNNPLAWLDSFCLLDSFCFDVSLGMCHVKLKRLLLEAYSDLDSEASEIKVNKRLLLFTDR